MSRGVYSTDGPKRGVMKPGHAEIHVGPLNAADRVLAVDLDGSNLIRVGFPPRGLAFVFTSLGVYVMGAAGEKRLSWAQVARFVANGELEAKTYGLVCDGALLKVCASKREAEDHAADLRVTFRAVEVVEVAPELAARLAK